MSYTTTKTYDLASLSTMRHLISKHAVNSLYKNDQTFAGLLTIRDTAFDKITLVRMETPPKGYLIFRPIPDDEKSRYEVHFSNIQQFTKEVSLMEPKKTDSYTTVPNIAAIQETRSISSQKNGKGYILNPTTRALGFAPYYVYTCPSELGTETLYVFVGKDKPVYGYTSEDGGKKCKGLILISAPTPELCDQVLEVMGFMSDRTPFTALCAGCGNTTSLKLCPCKQTSYCSQTCQSAHLPFHRPVCPCSKDYGK